MFEEQFCERLAQLRLKKGVSARDMSLSLGQSESYINRIENKSDYLGITPKDFFDFSDESLDLELADAINKLNRLSKEKRQHILAVINDLE